MAEYGEIFRSRLLDQRSRLEFYYPQEGIIMFVPFYENPKITESQSANYAEYNPIGRAGSLYAYTGAKSRKIKVKMTFTLPHLAMHDMGIDRFTRIFSQTTKESQKLLFTSKSRFSTKPKPGDVNHSLSLEVEKVWVALQSHENMDDIIGLEEAAPFIFKDALRGGKPLGSESPGNAIKFTNLIAEPEEKHKVIDTLLFFLALFRTSVTNNATNPMLGPPIIRLSFGTMYQSVPCICKSYTVGWLEDAKYDLETLTPRRVEVGLQLEELRVGDFGTYDAAIPVKRDNLAGWESAIGGYFTTDPMPLDSFGKGG